MKLCVNKKGNTNFIYDDFYWCNNTTHKFYCWTCYSCEKKINIAIYLDNNGDFYIKDKFQHSEKCINTIKKMKIIKEFINNFNKDDSEYREIIDIFKSKINEGKISNDKLELAEKVEDMLASNKAILLLEKKGKIANHYKIMAEIIEELKKVYNF